MTIEHAILCVQIYLQDTKGRDSTDLLGICKLQPQMKKIQELILLNLYLTDKNTKKTYKISNIFTDQINFIL